MSLNQIDVKKIRALLDKSKANMPQPLWMVWRGQFVQLSGKNAK